MARRMTATEKRRAKNNHKYVASLNRRNPDHIYKVINGQRELSIATCAGTVTIKINASMIDLCQGEIDSALDDLASGVMMSLGNTRYLQGTLSRVRVK